MNKNGKMGWRYSAEEKGAAGRIVRTLRAELGTGRGTGQRVALQLGYGVESVRSWVRQAGIDDGVKPGVASDAVVEVQRLEPELSQTKRATEVITQVASFCGASAPTQDVAVFVDANKDDIVEGRKLGVELICRVLQLAPCAFYAARDRAPSARTLVTR